MLINPALHNLTPEAPLTSSGHVMPESPPGALGIDDFQSTRIVATYLVDLAQGCSLQGCYPDIFLHTLPLATVSASTLPGLFIYCAPLTPPNRLASH